jgi:murein L,D-transpeptidase YafK
MLLQLALLSTVHTTTLDSVRVRPPSPPAATRTASTATRTGSTATRTAPAARARRTSAIGIADSLVLLKAEHKLTLYAQGRPLRSYYVALGRNPSGKKTRRGDGRTPEGLYYIDSHNERSQYHLSLHISYPNADDVARAHHGGFTPGGDIMIHGLPDQFASVGALHRQQDWTLGCVAVTDEEVEEIFNAVPDGTPILIVPE